MAKLESKALVPVIVEGEGTDRLIISPYPKEERSRALLVALDQNLEAARIPLNRARFVQITTGNGDHYLAALNQYYLRVTVGPELISKLTAIGAQLVDPLQFHFVRRLGDFYGDKTDLDLSLIIERELEIWVGIRAELRFGDGLVRGEWGHREAIEREPNSDRRHLLYHSLHSRNTELAEVMIRLREKRNEFAKHYGHTNFYDRKLKETYGLTRNEAQRLRTEVYNSALPYYTRILDRALLEAKADHLSQPDCWYISDNISPDAVPNKDQTSVSDSQVLFAQLVRLWGLEKGLSKLDIDISTRPGKELARCCPIDPPHDVRVVLNPGSASIYELATTFEELGHGMHFSHIDANLPFVFRSSDHGVKIWTEAMASLFVGMLKEPEFIKYTGVSEKELQRWCQSGIEGRLCSLVACELRLRFEEAFYGNEGMTQLQANELWRQLNENIDPRVLVENSSWANDFYLGEYPVYTLNYVLADLVAAQIRSYGRRKFDSLLSPEFGKFLKEQCFSPGFSEPWRELLQKVTGEPLNPGYWIDEIKV